MDLVPLALLLIGLMFVVIALGVWIAVALAAIGYLALIAKISMSPGPILATSVWQSMNSWDLTALPMFILMGDILFRTKLSQDMFAGLAPWVSRLPGRLLHVNV